MSPHSPNRLALLPAVLAVSAALVLPAPLPAQSVQEQLPDLGTAAQSTLSIEDEYRIGRMVMRGLNESGRILEDPELDEYLRATGLRLASQANDGSRQFNFFLVRDRAINAFALPGGFIGIHTGLLLETGNESELAGVLAHEIAHVTQRHIARGIESGGRTSLVSTAAVLAAILLGAVAGVGSDATMGAISAAQGLAAQAQINFTRENEYEADRIGIGILAAAGYEPDAMGAFFETMARRTQLGPDQVPELLRTHPVTSARIAEARGRASQYAGPRIRESSSYALMKERARVLTTAQGADPRDYYASVDPEDPNASLAQLYGKALALMVAGEPGEALPLLRRLKSAYPETLPFHTALGQAQLATGDIRGALATLEKARELAPRNVPVTIRYGEALMRAGRPKKAHEVLLDLFNNVPPTQEQIRITAIAANAAGDVADAYSYMAEYHIIGGDLPLAINQLELALSVPGISEVQRARYLARLKELREALPSNRGRRGGPESAGGGSPNG
ncbi:MAG TPA: M48 family metalloprotease [Steroidobacteraceae bacterium]|nr:M48 family metalloprotease [Steroidobacteraceae bacterium]